MRAAETRKLAASSQRAVVAPNAATSTPPIGAPTSVEPCWMLARIPLARSMRTPASSTTSGSSAARAVAPGASSSAPRNTSAKSCQSSIPTVRSRSGIAATAAALARSAEHARRPEAEPVHDDAAEERREDDRQEVEEHREPRERRASGRDQDVPGDRELRDGIPGERDRVCRVHGVQRRASLHRNAASAGVSCRRASRRGGGRAGSAARLPAGSRAARRCVRDTARLHASRRREGAVPLPGSGVRGCRRAIVRRVRTSSTPNRARHAVSTCAWTLGCRACALWPFAVRCARLVAAVEPSMAANRVLARYLSAIAVASFETPAAAGMSRTGVPSSPSTRTTFALSASDSSDRSSKSSVFASRVCASNAVSWEGHRRRRTRPGHDACNHAVRAGDDRHVLREFDVEAADDRSQRAAEVADPTCSESLLPSLLDLAEQCGADLLRCAAGRRRADDPVATEPSCAPPAVPFLARSEVGRRRTDEDVAPALHAAEVREHACSV